MEDLLNIPELNVISSKEDDHTILFVAETKEPPKCCQKCGTISEHGLSKFGTKPKLFFDVPIRGKRTVITVNRQKYLCRHCGKTFIEDISGIFDPSHYTTQRLTVYIRKQVFKRTYTSIAEEIGVNEKTVRNIFGEYIAELEAVRKIVVPEWLGIDEIHIIGKPRCVLTNVKERTIVDMLVDRNLPTLRDYFVKIIGKRSIKYVTMDMWTGYKTISKEMLPQAKIVIDKFHVVKMANHYLEMVRKKIRLDLIDKDRKRLMHSRFVLLKRNSELSEKELVTLNRWCKQFPLLDTAYTLKETFYDIYEAETREEAIKLFREWERAISSDVGFAFQPLANMVNNWFDEIFNYFDCPRNVTNAYTESLNNLIRFTNRQGRGYSFEVLRAKMVYFREGQVEVKPINKKAMRNGDLARSFASMKAYSLIKQLPDAFPEESYGTSISTLLQEFTDEEDLRISIR